jgi:hypothetical protein
MASSTSATPNSFTVFGSNTPTFLLPNFTQMSIEKLESSTNYLAWLSQIEPIIRCNDVMGIIDGSEIYPPQFLFDESGQKSLNPDFTC